MLILLTISYDQINFVREGVRSNLFLVVVTSSTILLVAGEGEIIFKLSFLFKIHLIISGFYIPWLPVSKQPLKYIVFICIYY